MILLPLRYRLSWIGLIWLLVLVIAAGSLIPEIGSLGIPVSDKIEHFAAYFTLSVLGSGVVAARKLPWVMVCVLTLGLVLEAAQGLLTVTRSADWADVLANSTGILAAWLLVRGRVGWALTVEAWIADLRRR